MKITRILIKFLPTFKNAFLYFGGSIIQLFIGIFTSPIFARNLSAEEFGILGYYNSLASIILPSTILSLQVYYIMKYFRQNEEENKQLFSTLIIFLSIFNILGLSAVYGVLYGYFTLRNVSVPFFPYSAILLISMFLEVHKTFALIDFRVRKKAFSYFILVTSFGIINVGTALLLVVKFNGGAAGRMAGSLIASFILTVYIVYYFRHSLHFKLNLKLVYDGLRFSFPMIISAYFYLPMANLDRILLERLDNISELGYYSIGFNIANYLNVAAKSLMTAFEPDLIKYIIAKNTAKFILSCFVYAISLLFITAVFLLVSKPLVDFLTSGRYTRAYIYANYGAVTFLIMNLGSIPNTFILALQKSKYMLYINIIAGIIGLLVYKLFIARWQFIGGSYARIIVAFTYLLTISIFILTMIYKHKSSNQ